MEPPTLEAILAIVSMAGGAIAVVVKYARSTERRVDTLHSAHEQTKGTLTAHKKATRQDVDLLRASIDALRDDVDTLMKAHAEAGRQSYAEMRGVQELRIRLEDLQKVVEKMRDGCGACARRSELASLAEEQRQWMTETERTLGRIEGSIRSQSSSRTPK